MRHAVLVTLLGFVACSATPAPAAGFAGTWVMEVEGHPFMILTLVPEDGHYLGTLEQPNKWTVTSDGRTFSGVMSVGKVRPLTADASGKGPLRMLSTNPDNPADQDEFEFSLITREQGLLKKIVDAPLDPWPMTLHTRADKPHVWTGWDAKRSYALQEPYVEPNPEMAEIYKADQAPRQSLKSFTANAKQIDKDDAARRERVRALVDTGKLRAAEDFRLAAMVFQHGNEPRDYLFAHTLALIALEKGDRSASWIAAASLDRYLHSIDRQQIFGLQFQPDGASRAPLDGELVSDALRKQLGVPTLAEQQAQMQQVAGK